MNHYAYILTFPDGMQYFGARSTHLDPHLDTTYLGSGSALPQDRKDTCNVSKTIVNTFPTREELMAFEYNFIVQNGCVQSPDWLNRRSRTHDRFGSEPWNKGISIDRTQAAETYSRRYKNNRTPAMLKAHAETAEKIRGTKNPAKAHHGTDNSGFKPWYYITPEGVYTEVLSQTKGDMAAAFGVSQRQLIHRFHHTNEHQPAKTKPLKGYVFGNLPRPTDTAAE